MNKLLGQLMTMLYAPAEKNEGAGGQGEEAPSDGDIYGNKGVKIPTKEELDARPDDEPDGDELAKRELEGEEGEEKQDFTEDESEENEGEGAEEDQEEGEQEEGEEVEKKEPTFLRIHPDDLKKVASPAGQQEEKMTPEQLRQAFNPVEVTEDTLKALGFAEPTKEQVKGFQEFANATVKNAVSIARLLIQKETKRFESAMGPIQGFYQEQQKNQAFQRFYGQHKDLAKFPQIVKIAANEVEPTNPDGSPMTEKQLFNAVAVVARKQLKQLGISNVTQPNANHRAGNGKPVPSANKLSSPGRSGGDQHSSKGKQNNPDADIYVGR